MTSRWAVGVLALCLGACGGAETRPAEPRASERSGHGHGHGHVHGAGAQNGPLVHRFENADEWARQFDDPGRNAWQKPEEVVRLMEITPGMTVADLGAGTGYFMKHLSNAVGPNGRVLALDVEHSMVRHMRRRAVREGLQNVQVREVPFDDPQIEPGSVHRVLIVDTWHHIADRTTYSRKLRDGLAPGGSIIVVDFTLEATRGPPRNARMAPEVVAQELAAAGLRTEILTETLPDQYIVRASL